MIVFFLAYCIVGAVIKAVVMRFVDNPDRQRRAARRRILEYARAHPESVMWLCAESTAR